MRRQFGVALALLLAMAWLPATVFADNSTSATAIVLTGDNAGDAGRLVGNTGGAGRYYRIAYGGSSRQVTIKVTSVPSRAVTGNRFGFKVYGPVGLLGEAAVEHDELSYTRYMLTLASVTPGDYEIQIYDFNDGLPVDYNIQVDGLASSATGVSESVAEAPVAGGSASLLPLGQTAGPMAGMLVGDANGTLQLFSVEYPGMQTQLQLQMQYSPPSPYQNNAVGFQVYGSDGKLLCRGDEGSRDDTAANVSCGIQQEVPDSLTVQAFNYQPGLTVNYTVSGTGASAPPVEVRDNATPDKAFVLSAFAPAARGLLAAGSEPTYNFLLLNYPGGNVDVNIGIVADQIDGYYDGMIGFNIYQGADFFGSYRARLNDLGNKRIASVPINQADAQTFGIQVFNWTKGMAVPYRLYVTGLTE